MIITLENIGKKFNRKWIFKDVSIEIPSKSVTAIVGPNGSGKSTLLQIIAGYLSPSRGSIKHYPHSDEPQLFYSFVSPYFELIEEYTLNELLNFHSQFKKNKIPFDEMIERANLSDSKNKLVGLYSSGMKQRVKLLLAFFFDAQVVFLDEPTSNLDQEGIDWYQSEISKMKTQSIVIASNQEYEYKDATKLVEIKNYI